MNRYIIELNDLGIRQAMVCNGAIRHFDEVAGGIAWKKGKEIVFGNEAESARAHAPRDICDQFWERLDTGTVELDNFHCNHAELAAEQLDRLYKKDFNATEVICIIPSYYQDNQRGILAGIARDIGLPLRYMIPRPLAYCAFLEADSYIHVDFTLKNLTISRIEGQPTMSVVETTTRQDTGYTGFVRRWLKSITAEFVSVCRIDPLHSAESEQMIRSSIPSILTRLAADPEVSVPVTIGKAQSEIKIEVNTEMITGWSIFLLSKIQKEVKSFVSNCKSCAGIHLGYEASCLPGLRSVLARELDLRIVCSAKNEIFSGIAGDWPPAASDDRCLFLPHRPTSPSSP